MDRERIEKAAAFMHQTHIDGSGHRRIPESIRPRSLGEAYAAQEAFHRLRLGTESPSLAGYKIAATSKAIQEQVGLHEPFLGAILPGMIHRLATCAVIRRLPAARNRVRDRGGIGGGSPSGRRALRPGGGGREAVCAVQPAFELLDMRNCNLRGIDATSSITDNAMISGVVLGPRTAAWRECGIGDLTGSATPSTASFAARAIRAMRSAIPWRGSPGLRTTSPGAASPCMPAW